MKFSNVTHLGMIEGSHFSTPTEPPPLKLRPVLRLHAITITSMTKLVLTEVVMPNFLKIINRCISSNKTLYQRVRETMKLMLHCMRFTIYTPDCRATVGLCLTLQNIVTIC